MSSPFFPVSHCFRGCSKKNLKIYDVINCLNKNLITHFVWYLEKEIRCDIETLSIIRVSNKEHFNGKIMQKMCASKNDRSVVPDPFLILWYKLKQLLHARNSFKNKIFSKRITKKPLKSQLYFFFQTHSLLMNKVFKNKRGLELVTGRSSGYEKSSEKFLYSLYIIWPSLMMLCEAVFEFFQKLHLQIYASQFMTS